ncbi:MAG: outer membrane protein assembly factor BamD [Bacteroidaceae bacterium]|jgi:outer membrane protein assembly factor BamD|nr:outer membrane protein assembly factor BamD [Bacteroidaceae bacterium]
MGNSRLFFLPLLLVLTMLTACSEFSAVLKSDDYEYKYEAAKALYADGQYRQAAELFSMLLAPLKGTSYGEESLYMLAESNLKAKDYESAAMFFKKYYQVYPKGHYMEMARFNSGYSLYKQVADIRLDQTSTMEAIREYQDFLDYCPNTSLKEQTHAVIYELQDRLVEKEYLSAKLYYDLGTYTLNSIYGGNNYEACVVTAQNALKDYPYASAGLRENLSILILRAKYHLARQSVEAKRVERFRDAIDEYYAFENDFPESKYLQEANSIFRYSQRMVERKGGLLTDDDALVEKDGILEEAKEVKTKKQKKKEQKDS